MRDLFRDSNQKSKGEGKFSFIEKVAQNALWREDFGKKACLHFSYKNIILKYSKNMNTKKLA